MARKGGGGIVGAVALAGVGLVVGSIALLSSEKQRQDPPVVTVFEDQQCEDGAWAVVIRDGERRACLSIDDARELLRRDTPFEYECTVPAPVPAPELEPPERPGGVDGPVAVVQGVERL